MTPEELQATTRDLRDLALRIRRDRNRLRTDTHGLPHSVTIHLTTAAQELDNAATDLGIAFGPELPEGVL